MVPCGTSPCPNSPAPSGRPTMTTTSTRPIFIVGCQRSGTTLLRLMLDSHQNISCGPETRFLQDFAKLTSESWARLSPYGLPKSYWLDKAAQSSAYFHDGYVKSRAET